MPPKLTDDDKRAAQACMLALAVVAIESDDMDAYKEIVRLCQQLKRAI